MSRVIRSAAIGAAITIAAASVVLGSSALTPHASTTAGVHVESAAQLAKAAKAREALLKYLKNGRPQVQVIHKSGLKPSRKDLRAPKPSVSGFHAPSNVASASSYNWAGYVTTSTTQQAYSAVIGNWRVPTLHCTSEQELVSDWIGLDGYNNSSTVEQLGSLGWCFEGTAYYYTWWEMYPSATQTVGTTVNPQDTIAARITRSGTSYTFSLTDSTTTGNNISATQSCAAATCLDESAEWVHERPSFSIGVAPLANSWTWRPYNGFARVNGTTNSIGSSPNVTALTMDDATGTYNLTTTAGLSATGAAFSVKYVNSY